MAAAFTQSADFPAAASNSTIVHAPLVHHSALIAWGTYVSGLFLAVALAPGMVTDILTCGNGAITLLAAFAGFIMVIGMIQRHMGTALSASQTVTPPKLSTSGIFTYTRNPIYLAFIMPLAALSVYSPAASLSAIAVYVAATTYFVIKGEEKDLRRLFGNEYDTYLRTTPRWLFI